MPRLAVAAVLLALATASLWLRAQLSDTRPIPELMPAGALLYLEAKDFQGLLSDWNNSTVKSRWLKSVNRTVLAESRLVQRLSQAQDEFAKVTGMPLGLSLADQTAGRRSGFAFYDLSALRFVYLSQMPESHLDNVQLWRDRTKYTPREVSGISFYLKTSNDGSRTVAFASYKDWFFVATDENLAAETLVLLSGRKAASMATDGWFQAATKDAATQGDLRLVYNLTALIATPQFRTYWLHRNATELKPFSAGISDLFRQQDGWKEERVMLRQQEVPVASAAAALRSVLAYVPPSAGLYRAWSMPDRNTLNNALQSLIAPEQPQTAVFESPAPEVNAQGGDVGTEADLEIRIDEPPFQHAANLSIAPLIDAVTAMQPVAMLQAQTTRKLGDQVFVMPSSGLVIACNHPNRNALDRALAQVRRPLGPGLVDPLTVSVNGNTIVITRLNLSQTANAIAVPANVQYLARYNHAAEWPNYKKLFGILDRTPSGPEGPSTPNGPPFFSGNIESLGDTLSGLRKASIISTDTGAAIHETVIYEWAQP